MGSAFGAEFTTGGADTGGTEPIFFGPVGLVTSFFSSSLSLPKSSISLVAYLGRLDVVVTGLSWLTVLSDLRFSPSEPLTDFS